MMTAPPPVAAMNPTNPQPGYQQLMAYLVRKSDYVFGGGIVT